MSGEKVIDEEHRKKVKDMKTFLRGTNFSLGRPNEKNNTFDLLGEKETNKLKFSDLKNNKN